MCRVNDFVASLCRLQARHRWAYQLAQVVSCGGMIGTAMFYPLDALDSRQYCSLLLATFVVSAAVWHTLSIEAFIGYGIFTVPPGLLLMLLVVALAGPSRADLAAWLPLVVSTLSVITVVIKDSRQYHRAAVVSPDEQGDDASSLDEDQLQRQHRHQHSAVIERFLREPEPNYGLWPRFPHIAFTERSRGTTLTLSSTPAQVRPSWGSRVLGFFVDPTASWRSRQLSRSPSQSSFEGPGERDDASLDGNVEPPPDAELGLTSPLLAPN